MNQTFTQAEIIILFQKTWMLISQTDLLKTNFSLSNMTKVRQGVFEATGYDFSERTYFNLFSGNGSEKDSSVEALCAYILLKENLIGKKELVFKEIENKAKGWKKQITDKPPQNIYSLKYYKHFIQKQSEENNFYRKHKIVFMILSFGLFFLGLIIFNLTNTYNIKNRLMFNEADSTNLRILLLPFKPDNQCTDIENDLQNSVFDSLIIKKNKYDIDVLKTNDLRCPTNEDEARKIGKLKNADLVIWGIYETKEQKLNANLKFSFVNNTFRKKLNESSNSIAMLKSGNYNSFKIDNILDWTFLLSLYYKRDIKNAEKYLENIINNGKLGSLSAENILFLSDVCLNIGDFENASKLLQKCLELAETQKNNETKTFALAKMSLVQMFLTNGNLTEIYKEAATKELSHHLSDIKYSSAIKELGYCYLGLQQISEATTMFEIALNLELKNPKTDSLILATSYFYAGYAHFFGQNLDRANYLIGVSGKIAERSNDLLNSSELLGGVYEILSGIASRKKDFKNAYIIQQKSLAHSKNVLPANHVNMGTAYCNLGFTQLNIELLSEAEKSFNKAIAIFKNSNEGYFINGTADTYSGLGVLELKKNNFSKSATYQRNAIKLALVINTNNPSIEKYYYRAADIYNLMNRKDSALIFINESIRLSKKSNKLTSLKEAQDFRKLILKKKIRK
jgi:tetratricopeptide (TPR) repeat protein